MLNLLTRRDDALLEKFYKVLEDDDQKHVVKILRRDETGSCCRQQDSAFRSSVNAAAGSGGQHVDETEVKMLVEEHLLITSGCDVDGISSASLALLDSNVDMDCLSEQPNSTQISETACKTAAGRSAREEDVGCDYLMARSREQEDGEIELRDYQKELARSGIEGQNLIICAPTGSGKTFTAGHICQQRRLQAKNEGRRFKAIFIVCIRNLITQQTDAVGRIMGNDVVRGADDNLDLSTLSEYFDVIIATAQVLIYLLTYQHNITYSFIHTALVMCSCSKFVELNYVFEGFKRLGSSIELFAY